MLRLLKRWMKVIPKQNHLLISSSYFDITSKIIKGNCFWNHDYSLVGGSVLVSSGGCTFKNLFITIATQYFDFFIQQQHYPSCLLQTETSCTVTVAGKLSQRWFLWRWNSICPNRKSILILLHAMYLDGYLLLWVICRLQCIIEFNYSEF